MSFLILTCTVGLQSGIMAWDGISVHHPQMPRPWNPIRAFLLSPADRAVVETCHGETNRHSVAVLLKTVQYLGYFPEDLQHVPLAVRTFIAHQLHLLWDHTADYPWQSSTRDRHLALIRQHTGWRFPTAQDKQALEAWLQTHAAPHAPTEAD